MIEEYLGLGPKNLGFIEKITERFALLLSFI